MPRRCWLGHSLRVGQSTAHAEASPALGAAGTGAETREGQKVQLEPLVPRPGGTAVDNSCHAVRWGGCRPLPQPTCRRSQHSHADADQEWRLQDNSWSCQEQNSAGPVATEHRNLFLFQHSSAWLQFSEEEIGTFIGHSFLSQPAAARLQSQNTVKEHTKKIIIKKFNERQLCIKKVIVLLSYKLLQ